MSEDSSCPTVIERKAVCLDELMLEYLNLADENRSYNTLFDLFESIFMELYNPIGVIDDPCYDLSPTSTNEKGIILSGEDV